MASRVLRSFAIFTAAAGLRKRKTSEGVQCAQWGNMACAGSECYTCGDRITYLQSQGMSSEAAGQQVADEFPSECGQCGGTPSGPCESWCEDDYNGGNNAGRHCSPGDMAYLCGGCSFCGGSSPSPSPSPPPVDDDCARRLNNYDQQNAACLVKNNTLGMLVYVPYGSPGWDFPGGQRNSGEYSCQTAERETCEESSHKVRALYQLSSNVFMCELVEEGYCKNSVAEGFLETRWVSKGEVYNVNYRPGTWGDKPGILYANL